MGIEATCHSSAWYREQVSLAFTSSTHDVRLIEGIRQDKVISDGITLNSQAREITYQNFNPRHSEVRNFIKNTNISQFFRTKKVLVGSFKEAYNFRVNLNLWRHLNQKLLTKISKIWGKFGTFWKSNSNVCIGRRDKI